MPAQSSLKEDAHPGTWSRRWLLKQNLRKRPKSSAQQKVCTPELWGGVVCEGQVGLVEGLDGSNVLPVAVIEVGLDVHAHVLRARDHLAAKVVRLRHTQPSAVLQKPLWYLVIC